MATLLLGGCGGEVPCRTACGLEFLGMYDGSRSPWTCEALQSAEDATLHAFDTGVHGDDRFRTSFACQAIGDYRLYLYPEKSWISADHGFLVSGLTYCESFSRRIVVGLADDPKLSALPHELAHAVQTCSTRYRDSKWPSHEGWNENGVFSAIGSVRAQ